MPVLGSERRTVMLPMAMPFDRLFHTLTLTIVSSSMKTSSRTDASLGYGWRQDALVPTSPNACRLWDQSKLSGKATPRALPNIPRAGRFQPRTPYLNGVDAFAACHHEPVQQERVVIERGKFVGPARRKGDLGRTSCGWQAGASKGRTTFDSVIRGTQLSFLKGVTVVCLALAILPI